VLSAPVIGILLAVIMATLSGMAGVYTELIMKKRPQRNVNVQNIYLYVWGIVFNTITIFVYDYDAVVGMGFFHGSVTPSPHTALELSLDSPPMSTPSSFSIPGIAVLTLAYRSQHRYTPIVFIMILNHALSGIAVSLVMKFADNIVKVYSTSVAMVLTTLVSIPLFGFRLTLPFVLGTSVTSVAVFLHYQSKAK
jgi:UDP-sugar transporter A1/2/3